MEKTLDAYERQKTSYCIDLWLRDEQIKLSVARIKGRIKPYPEGQTRDDPVAVVCYGPTLRDTWEEIRDFKYVISCSGSHRFLIDRGIIPTYHCDVDPRAHKAILQGQPHKDVEYLISSTCHQAVFDHLEGYDVKLWHVFDAEKDAMRMLPFGEWAITGGPSVGLRAMTLARFLGFTKQIVFGMDGCENENGKHAAEHILLDKVKKFSMTTYCNIDGCPKKDTEYKTNPSMLSVAQGTWHELDMMVDVEVEFRGQGLVQHMAEHYVRTPNKKSVLIGFEKPALISPEVEELTRQLHYNDLSYGIGASKYVDMVKKLITTIDPQPSVLDYGCGKGYLAKALNTPIWEYDPAISGKEESPRPAGLVCCFNVLEYVEPEKLGYVLNDLTRCVEQVGFFIIHNGPANKTLADGRNAHLIQHSKGWWVNILSKFFVVAKVIVDGPQIRVVVGPKIKELAREIKKAA